MNWLTSTLKIHLLYGGIIFFYLLVSWIFFWILLKKKDKTYRNELRMYKKDFLGLIDQLNYVASENMIELEKKFFELQTLLDRIRKEKLAMLELFEKIERLSALSEQEFQSPSSVESPKVSEKKQASFPSHKFLDKSVLEEKEILGVDSDLNREESMDSSFYVSKQILEPLSKISRSSPFLSGENIQTKPMANFNFAEEDIFYSNSYNRSTNSKNDNYNKVLQFYQQGYPVDEIISKTGLSKGAVNLIISLYEQKKGN
jgi:hypothetical protein